MKQVISQNFTPQRKAITVNDKFGNTGIKQQQGSTVVKYDTLQYTGQTEMRFFEGSSQRNFPLSNTGSDGNKLGVGNSLVVERAYLTILTKSIDGDWDTVEKLDLTTTAPSILLSEFGFSIANSEVIKNVPVLSWVADFNKDADNELNTNFEFDTQVVIPPLLEYVATLRLPGGKVPGVETYIRLTIEGTGAIIAPRATF